MTSSATSPPAQCQVRAKEGEACAYVDPTFERYSEPWRNQYPYYAGDGRNIYQDDQARLRARIDLQSVHEYLCQELLLDGRVLPLEQLRVPRARSARDRQRRSLIFSNERYSYYVGFLGVCSAPFPEGAVCAPDRQRVREQDVRRTSRWSMELKCQPALAADGAGCTVAGNCASNHCGADLKCSPACDLSNSNCEGAACRTVPQVPIARRTPEARGVVGR